MGGINEIEGVVDKEIFFSGGSVSEMGGNVLDLCGG